MTKNIQIEVMHMVAPAPFTAENAAEMSRKGWEMRNAEKARLLNDSAELAKLKAELTERPLESDRAKRLSRQMDLIEKEMRGKDGKLPDAKDLSNLTAAHTRLFNAWKDLTGLQSPGVRKVSRTRQTSNVQPIAPTPAPSSVEIPNISKTTEPSPTSGPRSEDCTG